MMDKSYEKFFIFPTQEFHIGEHLINVVLIDDDSSGTGIVKKAKKNFRLIILPKAKKSVPKLKPVPSTEPPKAFISEISMYGTVRVNFDQKMFVPALKD